MKLAIGLFIIATTVAGCAATFDDRWMPVKPLLEWNGGKADRLDRKDDSIMDHLRPAKSSTKSQLAFGG
jgi:hypothetical protein